jgi:hypothetical protein
VAGKGTQQTDLGDRFQYNAALSYRLLGQTPALAGARPAYASAPLAHSARPGYQGLPPQVRPHRHQHGHSDHHHLPIAAPQWTVDLALELNGEWHARQEVAGVLDPNSGGHTLYLGPGVRVGYGSVSGFASIGVPILNQMNGLQSKPDYRVVAGMVAAF